jgi:thiamine-phosphate diphosphorylase
MSLARPTLVGLYAIVDDDAWRRAGVDLSSAGAVEAIVASIVAARPAALQLRAKHLDARATLALLRRIGPVARAADVAFFGNDRADLAALARSSGVVGVHVGQDDLDAEDVRRFDPALRVGVSTHDRAQLIEATRTSRSGLDYVPTRRSASRASPSSSSTRAIEPPSSRSAACRARRSRRFVRPASDAQR